MGAKRGTELLKLARTYGVDQRRVSYIASFPNVHPHEFRDPIAAGQNPRAISAVRREDVGTARDLGQPHVLGDEDRVQMQ
jgi:hypothetical protein